MLNELTSKINIENKGLVSIIMPVYNGFPLIKCSIQSLLNQTYTNWECIIVNDGSVDGTKEYLETLDKSRFVIHHFEKNQGRPLARQKALDLAKGEFIAMLDADDLYHPQKLEIQVKIMNDNPDIYLVGSGMCSFGTNENFIRIRSKGDGLIHQFENKEPFPVAHASSLLRHEHANKFLYNPKLTFGQDVDFLSKYLYKKKFIVLPDVLYFYSEFDSVTKEKIQKTYKLLIQKFYKSKEYKNSFFYVAKLLYSYVIYPFTNINSILKKRGRIPSNQELIDYEKYCYSIIKNIAYQ